jgi:WhiB family redox-sensing transcriptional regulator
MTSRSEVPVIDAEQLRWQRTSACRGRAEFFDEDSGHPPLRHYREVRARALCLRCPVRAPCAAYALRRREPYWEAEQFINDMWGVSSPRLRRLT